MLHAWPCQHILLETASMEGQTVTGHGHALQNTLKDQKTTRQAFQHSCRSCKVATNQSLGQFELMGRGMRPIPDENTNSIQQHQPNTSNPTWPLPGPTSACCRHRLRRVSKSASTACWVPALLVQQIYVDNASMNHPSFPRISPAQIGLWSAKKYSAWWDLTCVWQFRAVGLQAYEQRYLYQ